MKILKYITPFIWAFPVCLFFAFQTWQCKYAQVNLKPTQGLLFIGIGFTMLVVDLLMKYLIGKHKIYQVWIIEVLLVIILCVMIIPQLAAEIY